jgi:hypothetical protein
LSATGGQNGRAGERKKVESRNGNKAIRCKKTPLSRQAVLLWSPLSFLLSAVAVVVGGRPVTFAFEKLIVYQKAVTFTDPIAARPGSASRLAV